MHILKTVRDMAAVQLGMFSTVARCYKLIAADAAGTSVPRSVCRALILTVLQDLPTSLMDVETLPRVSVIHFFTGIELTPLSSDESPTPGYIDRCPKDGVSSPERCRKETYRTPRYRSWS